VKLSFIIPHIVFSYFIVMLISKLRAYNSILDPETDDTCWRLLHFQRLRNNWSKAFRH